MRERPNDRYPDYVKARITPAYAGKTRQTAAHAARCQDHPRVCGKDCRYFFVFWDSAGSPPRMRERQGKHIAVRGGSRITPAYAGKTVMTYMSRPYGQDHPRVCGKDVYCC